MKRFHKSLRISPQPRAFTLLEVLVALAIVAVTLLAAMRAVVAMNGNTQRLREAVLAEACAENWLTTARLQNYFPAPGDTQASCQQAGVKFTVEVNAATTLNPSFMRVRVQVKNEQQERSWVVLALLRRR